MAGEVAFIVAMSRKAGEAGADWTFVALLASAYIVGGGVAVGMAIAVLLYAIRWLLKVEGKDNSRIETKPGEPAAAPDRPPE